MPLKVSNNSFLRQKEAAEMDEESIRQLEESLAESTPVREPPKTKIEEPPNGIMSSVSGSDSGACYPGVNWDLSQRCHQAIFLLKQLSYLSDPPKIAAVLETIFGKSQKPGHWLWQAQHYNPRQIIWTLNEIAKRTERGIETINNPGGYFTDALRWRKRRKKFRKKEAAK